MVCANILQMLAENESFWTQTSNCLSIRYWITESLVEKCFDTSFSSNPLEIHITEKEKNNLLLFIEPTTISSLWLWRNFQTPWRYGVEKGRGELPAPSLAGTGAQYCRKSSIIPLTYDKNEAPIRRWSTTWGCHSNAYSLQGHILGLLLFL